MNKNNDYWNKERIEQLKQLTFSAFSEKTKYESLWYQIARYCGLNKYFQNERQNDKRTDIEVNDSTAIISLNQSSDSMLGILIGDGNFFKIKQKDKLEEVIENINNNNNINLEYNKDDIDEYLEYVNFILKEQFFHKESNFINNLHKTIKEYFAFGNSGMGVFKKDKYIDFNNPQESKLNFINYSINNCAFIDGKDGEVNNIYLKYKWSAKKIIETFAMADGEILKDVFDKLPAQIKESYNNNYNKLELYTIYYILINNKEKKIGASEGIYSAEYVGIFVSFDYDYIFKKEYFKNNPIKIIRDNIRTGEIYGKGLAGNIISEIKLLNKISGDCLENIENVTSPYLAMYENSINENVIELNRNKPLVLKADKINPTTNSPIFPIIPAGDISRVVQIIIPELKKNIASGLKSDIFLDFNAESKMTATEVQVRNNIRNKILFANALDFQNLLNNLIFNSYKILFMSGEYDSKKNQTIKYLEDNNIDFFEIEYTSELAQISKQGEINNILSMFQTMAQILSLCPQDQAPQIIKKIDFDKVMDKLAEIYNRKDLLFTEEEFKKMIEEEQANNQVAMQLAQLQNDKLQADINNQNSQTNKNQQEVQNLINNNQ